MRYPARLIGLAFCLLVLLNTCASPFGVREAGQGDVVADAAFGPTVLPTVTPLLGGGEAIGGNGAAAAPPLSGMMESVTSAPPPPLTAVERAERMDGYLASLTQQASFSGSVLVAHRGHVLLSRGYGLANREEALPATARTRYRLASVTKPFTAMAALRLVASDRLALEASICRYLAPCPPAWEPVTVNHLLRQASGIPNYTDFADFVHYELQPSTPEQLVARFRHLPLGFTPGTIYHYTNSNFLLLGLIIEAASGQSYAELLHDEIFAPLGMENSGQDPGDFSPLEGTRGYAGAVRDIPLNASNLFAAGDLYATVEDLYLFALALDGNQLLPPELAGVMVTPGPGRYALGWMVEQRGERRLVYHPGSMSGAATWFGRYPDEGLTVIVLSNNAYANMRAITDTLTVLALE
ncbi:MAG: class A beta-lactamase-related serine hydrolase [Candidatus Viridilinea halotolerans]|uniref:Class A beta-lactamase-related serine hydrolase n=1 Tax=Candidatus Viridilinea halotolerans TaxID=2491704 RepID=A0A426TW30_9CHLR|nr:MAG: class A beta-lactamase-related serine hydrolase [Candidatus Viridilinea halotolerans]